MVRGKMEESEGDREREK
jgi:hypothetical protein